MRILSGPRRRAFTLPEVLAALAVVGIVLPSVMKGLSIAMTVADDARKKVEATALADNKLAELTADAMTGITSGSTTGSFGEEWPAYQFEASTSTVDVDLAEIRVRVSWTSRGAARSVDLTTFAYTGTGATTTDTATPAGGSATGGGQ